MRQGPGSFLTPPAKERRRVHSFFSVTILVGSLSVSIRSALEYLILTMVTHSTDSNPVHKLILEPHGWRLEPHFVGSIAIDDRKYRAVS